MSVEIFPVHATDIDTVWDECEPIIKRALDHSYGESSLEGIRLGLKQNQTQLWVVIDKKIIACCICQIYQYELKRVLRGLYLAGTNMRAWLKKLDKVLDEYGRRWGCTEIELYGRKGWLRRLEKMNYTEGYYMARREIG